MSDDTRGVLRFEPYADYCQFHVQDARAKVGTIDGDSWVNTLEDWRVAVADHAIAVGTARYDYVPVVLDIRGQPPVGDSFEPFDHVIEVDIEVPSGELAVTGCTEPPSEVEPIRISPGRYRVRVGYAPTDYRPARSQDYEVGDYLRYDVTMWPTAVESDVVVLKQGQTPWAY